MDLTTFISSANSLFCPSQKGLLAVSGGVDSVVLLHLMCRAGYPVEVAHCNFHLRPGDCDRDEAFVRALAQRYGVAIHVAQFSTESYARQHHLSIEEAARRQRYDFFHLVRQRQGLDYIATAHHRDDAAETFFINLLRGSGVAGLHGIPARNGAVVRPLLPFSRQEIEAYAASEGLDHVVDATNASTLYLRNRIRHQLLPLLRQIDPQADQALQRTMRHLADTEIVYRQAIDRLRADLVRDGAIAIDAIDQLHPQRTLLFELLRPYGFTAPQVDDILSSLHHGPGATYLSPTHRLHRDRGRLLIDAAAQPSAPWPAEGQEKGGCEGGESFSAGPVVVRLLKGPVDIEPARHRVYFDAAQVQMPLRVRHWQQGDRFHPFGMRGTQLLSDYFTTHHFSRPQREQALLLVDAHDTILWLVGHRAAHLPVTDGTPLVLEASIDE